MPKRKVALGSKTIAQLIEEGKPIQGLKVFAKFEDPFEVMVPVEIIGITVDPDTCGMSIKAKCINGDDSTFNIAVCRLFLNSTEIQLYRESRKRIADAQKDYNLAACRATLASRKEIVMQFVAAHNLIDTYTTHLDGKTDSNSIKYAFIETIIEVRKLNPEEIKELDTYRWS